MGVLSKKVALAKSRESRKQHARALKRQLRTREPRQPRPPFWILKPVSTALAVLGWISLVGGVAMFALAAMGLASLPGLTESPNVEAQAAAAGVLLLAAPWCLGGGFLAWAFFMTWSQGLLVMREHGLAARAVRESKTNEKADDGSSSTTA